MYLEQTLLKNFPGLYHSTFPARLVRFEGFLSRVPYKGGSGFGGIAASDNQDTRIQDGKRRGEAGDTRDSGYDRGMVQKIVLLILKAVALTTRESRYFNLFKI